jgi:hypothetical protein
VWRLWLQKLQTGLWWGLAEFTFSWSLESGGWFSADAFGRNLASVAMKFLNLMNFMKTLYKLRALGVIQKIMLK